MVSSPFRFIAVDGDAPPGFESIPHPTRRDLRGGLVALWATKPAELLDQLGPLRDKIRGAIFSPGSSRTSTELGPSLSQVEISEAMLPQLEEFARAWLELSAQRLAARDELARKTLELEREQADRERLIEKVTQETQATRELLEARTLWTARAMTSLVELSARRLHQLDRSELPAAILDYLGAEPFSLPNMSLWVETSAGWELRIERGAPLAVELPPPRSVSGIVQCDATTLLLAINTGTRETLLGLSRPGGFDGAGVSFLSLFCVQIEATYRTHGLHTALSLALTHKDSLIEELSTPVIQVWHDTVCCPVIGSVDSARIEQMSAALLDAVVRRGIHYVIIDFTGLGTMDTQTVHLITGLARAIALVGAECMLSGISPHVARTLVELGVELSDMKALPSVEAAIASRVRRQLRTATKARRSPG